MLVFLHQKTQFQNQKNYENYMLTKEAVTEKNIRSPGTKNKYISTEGQTPHQLLKCPAASMNTVENCPSGNLIAGLCMTENQYVQVLCS